jgi:hypothetical protein
MAQLYDRPGSATLIPDQVPWFNRKLYNYRRFLKIRLKISFSCPKRKFLLGLYRVWQKIAV